jgi:cyanate permease
MKANRRLSSVDNEDTRAADVAAIAGSGKIIETFHGSVYSLNAEEPKTPFYQRHTFLRIVVGILKEMTDFRLLFQNVGFLLITLSNFFVFVGYFTPFLYITKISRDNGIAKAQASFLISIIGIVNIPARMLFGFIADRKIISAINLNTFSVFVATVPLFLFIVMQYAYWSQMLFAVLFAIGIGNFFHISHLTFAL